MIAFVDESFRGGPAGVYVVAAAVIVEDHAEELRAQMRAVIAPRRPRFHWHGERDDLRFRMLRRIAELDVMILAHACRAASPAKQERARAHCLRGLLWDLRERAIGEVVVESRQEHNNRRDRATIANAQRAGGAARDLRYGFALPSVEPLLWIADAAAGSVSAKLCSVDDRYIAVLSEERLFITEITP